MVFVLDHSFGNVALYMYPDWLVRVQAQRIRRQQEEFQFVVCAFGIGTHKPGFVCGMLSGDEKSVAWHRSLNIIEIA
jgi:hypothetical protein